MNREIIRDTYYQLSGKLSDISRQLDFAGIALIWLFKVEMGGKHAIPSALLLPAALLVAALSVDLLQYIYSCAAWGVYNRILEIRSIPFDKEFKAPPPINWPTLVCFWSKVLLTVAAYVGLLLFLHEAIGTGA